MTELLYKDEVYAIQGAVFEVYREMGAGFLEPVYQECLEKEFTAREIPYVSQQALALKYKGAELMQTYKPDFVCYDKIIVEIKATQSLAPVHKSQLINYLSATDTRLGLLVNFGSHPKAEIERIIY